MSVPKGISIRKRHLANAESDFVSMYNGADFTVYDYKNYANQRDKAVNRRVISPAVATAGVAVAGVAAVLGLGMMGLAAVPYIIATRVAITGFAGATLASSAFTGYRAIQRRKYKQFARMRDQIIENIDENGLLQIPEDMREQWQEMLQYADRKNMVTANEFEFLKGDMDIQSVKAGCVQITTPAQELLKAKVAEETAEHEAEAEKARESSKEKEESKTIEAEATGEKALEDSEAKAEESVYVDASETVASKQGILNGLVGDYRSWSVYHKMSKIEKDVKMGKTIDEIRFEKVVAQLPNLEACGRDTQIWGILVEHFEERNKENAKTVEDEGKTAE